MGLFTSDQSPIVDGEKRFAKLIYTLGGIVTLLMVVMFLRVAKLQADPSPKLKELSSDRTMVVVEPARRGDITDRRGRVLASSHFGARVFVDPVEFPKEKTDEAIVKLSSAIGLKPDVVGPRIIERMQANEAKIAEAVDDEPLALSRYVVISGVVEDDKIDVIKKLKIPGVHLETRQVREVNSTDITGGIIGKVGFEDKGLMGTEKILDEKLQPKSGAFKYVHDRAGNPIWVQPDAYTPPERGTDLALSIDLVIQRIVTEQLERGVIEADAAGGRAVVMDPNTGEILAMVDIVRDLPSIRDYDWLTPLHKDELPVPGQRWRIIREDKARSQFPALGRNRCVEDIYEPGSTFKPFMWAAVTELGLARPMEVFNTHNGVYRVPYAERYVRDVHGLSQQTWQQVLINSSNVGMVIGTSRMSFQQMHDAVRKFGFGSKPGTGLPGETAGIVTPLKGWSNWSQTSCAYGYQVGVTPVQVARAFSAFARKGEANGTLPPVRLTGYNTSEPAAMDITNRVLPRSVADITRETLRGVTASLDRKLAARQVPEKDWKYELFGKSGTAQAAVGSPPPGQHLPKGSDGYFPQYNSSFVAGGPVENPRLVMIVVIDDPSPDLVRRKEHRGATIAGPVVRRSMEECLQYLGVPPSPPPSEEVRKREAH